jgi:hypothetical protein
MSFLFAFVGLPALLIGSVPTLFGFTASGIALGSFAAAMQAAMGNVAAGSCFAAMQSLGATGFFSTMAGWGGAATAAAGFLAFPDGKQTTTTKVDLTSDKDLNATGFLIMLAFLGDTAAVAAGLFACRGGKEDLATDENSTNEHDEKDKKL